MSYKKRRLTSSFADVCAHSERYILVLSFEKECETYRQTLNSFLQEVTSISQVGDRRDDHDDNAQLNILQRKHHVALLNPATCLKHSDQKLDADWFPLDHLHKDSSPKNSRRSSGKVDGFLGPWDMLENQEAVEVNINELDAPFAELIHALADKLPVTGHYLDVVWLATATTDLPITNYICIYGALQRLCSWHGGLLTVIQEDATPDGPHNGTLNVWVNHLHGRLVRGVDSIAEAVGLGMAWRGDIVVADGKGQKSLCVPGFVLSPHLSDNSKVHVTRVDGDGVSTSPRAKSLKSHTMRKIVTLSRQLEVVCTVRQADVPSIFLSPVTLSLHLLPGSRLPRSQHYLHWLSEAGQSDDAAVIVRLPCRTLIPRSPSTHSARPISTKAWKQHVKNTPEDLTVPDLHLRETQEFYYLLLHSGSGEHGQDVVAQVMYSPHEMSGTVHAQLTEYQDSLPYDEHQSARVSLNSLASLDRGQVQALLETIRLAQAEAIKTFIEEMRSDGREPAITLAELQQLMGAIYSCSMAMVDMLTKTTGANDNICSDDDLENGTSVSELDGSPSGWMQKLALQNHEALERKIKRFKSGDMMLAGMPVPAPADNTITLTAEEFLKHFQASGLPSTEDLSPICLASADKPSGVNSWNTCSNLSWSDLKKATFEEAQKYSFPGIQYCLDSGRSQLIDSRFSKMQQRYIRYETASTCSSEQAASPATLTIPQQSSAASPTPTTNKGKGHPHSGRTNFRGQRSADKGQRLMEKGQRSAEKGQRSAEKRRRIMLERALKISPGRSLGRGVKRKGPDEVSASLAKKRISPRKKLIPTRTSPRKRVTGTEKQAGKPLPERKTGDSHRASSSSSSVEARKLSRSEKTRMKLREIVKATIISRGVSKDSACYKPCIERLYKMAELYVKDLKTSKGLEEEMKTIAEANADFVVQFEQNRNKKS